MSYLNERLQRWVKRKYKRFRTKLGKAYDWLAECAAHNATLQIEINEIINNLNKRVKYEEPCDGRLSSTVPREGRVKVPPLTRHNKV